MKKTSLFDIHLKFNGKMVPFAGYGIKCPSSCKTTRIAKLKISCKALIKKTLSIDQLFWSSKIHYYLICNVQILVH